MDDRVSYTLFSVKEGIIALSLVLNLVKLLFVV